MGNASSMSSLLTVMKRHWWIALIIFASSTGAALVYLRVTHPLYTTSVRLMLDDKRVSISELGRALSAVPEGTPGGANPIATQAELIKSQRVLRRALAQGFSYGADNSSQRIPTIDELSKALKVKIVPATNILEVTYQNQDPNQAAGLLNAIAIAMVDENAETTRLEAFSVRKFLEIKVPEQQERLEQAELAENRYREATGIVSIEAQTQSLVNRLSSLEDQEQTLFSQLQQARTRDRLLQHVTGVNALKSAYDAVRIGQDQSLKDLRSKLVSAEIGVIDGRSRLGDRHPDLLALIQQRDELRSLYTRQLATVLPNNQFAPPGAETSEDVSKDLISRYVTGEIERMALESGLQTVQAERKNLQTRISQLPFRQQPLAALVRQREEAAASLKLLQGKLEEARIAEAQLISNVRIINKADVPVKPTVPKPAVALALAIVASSILSIGAILLLELMDDTLRDVREVEAAFQLPVLGDLPKLPSLAFGVGQPEHFLDDPTWVEPYRKLLKTLEFQADKKLKVIVISSVLYGEGKSAVVAHLAAVAAMLSKRTLVIDADLRQPLQHQFFNLTGSIGLTDVLSRNKPLSEAIKPTELEHLAVLAHGQSIMRPSAAVESTSMKALLENVAANYDFVLIDAAPASNCADAVALRQYADGLLFVARPHYTPKHSLRPVLSELKASGTSILGVAITQTPDPLTTSDSGFIGHQPPLLEALKHLRAQAFPIKNSKTI